jgi:hypothetical protein
VEIEGVMRHNGQTAARWFLVGPGVSLCRSPPRALAFARPLVLGALLVSLAATAGCSKLEAREEIETKASEASTVEVATAEPIGEDDWGLRVLDPGAEPRRVLRYRLREGTSEIARVRVEHSVRTEAMDLREMRISPEVWLDVRIAVVERLSEDTVRYEFELQRAQALSRRRVKPGDVRKAQRGLDAVTGLSGSATMSSSGRLLGGELDEIPPGLDIDTLQVLRAGLRHGRVVSRDAPARARRQGLGLAVAGTDRRQWHRG